MLQTTPLTGTLGATVEGVDLTGRNNRIANEIKKALAKYKVLVIPNQHDLSPTRLLTFAETFGAPERDSHPSWDDVPGVVGVKLIHPGEDAIGIEVEDDWHTDGSTRAHPSWLTFLHGHRVPEYGRDTMFADMEAAYERLSAPLQRFLDGMTALHSWGSQKPGAPAVEHPVILTDSETGRKTLYVSRVYTRQIVGLRKEESDALLELLFRQALVPELQLRVSWKPGTLTVWDNKRVQHYAVRDRVTDRILHRVMIDTTRDSTDANLE